MSGGIEAGPSRIIASPPLSSFNAQLQVRLFLQDLNVNESTSQHPIYLDLHNFQLLHSIAFDETTTYTSQELLLALSGLIGVPGLTEYVIRRFRPLLLDMIARWIESDEASAEEWERKLYVVAEMAEHVPELWNVIYGFLEASPFLIGSPLALCPEYDAIVILPASRLQLLLLAYNRLLRCDPFLARRQEWTTSPLIILYTSHPDPAVRMLAIKVFGRHQGLKELGREELELKYVGPETSTETRMAFGWKLVKEAIEGQGSDLVMRDIDGWVLNLAEHQLGLQYRQANTEEREFYAQTHLNQVVCNPSDFCARVAVVGNILAFKPTKQLQTMDAHMMLHVSTPSGNTSIQQMIYALDRRLPLLVSSAPSAGKSHLLHYLSERLYPNTPSTTRILTIALADTSIDAKALLGSYVSSPTAPGTFIWAEGALTKAVRSGRWVVLEDLDRASQEIQSLFAGLADELGPQKSVGARARLRISGKETVEAGDGFALIATRSVANSKHSMPPTFLGHNYFYEVSLESPTVPEVREILDAGFPRLQGDPAAALLDVYLRLTQPISAQVGQTGQSNSKGRLLGLRDLQKWCARINKLLPSSGTVVMRRENEILAFANPVLQDEIFLEATDIFVGSFDSTSTPSGHQRKMDIGKIIADAIGLGQERFLFLIGQRVPQMQIVGDVRSRHPVELQVGRCCLTSLPAGPFGIDSSDRPFALTKPSLILLERLAVGVSLAEPILLVGETGTGKTTAVQHLSGLLRRPLTVLNLSTQTESGDLLGGFKPIDAALPGRELHSRWIELFRQSFSRRKNEAYEGGVRKAINDGRWRRVAEMWAEAAKLAQDRLGKRLKGSQQASPEQPFSTPAETEAPRKRRKIEDMDLSLSDLMELLRKWDGLISDIKTFEMQHIRADNKLVFSFVEGPLVKALKNGEWILLDEVNLASQETLESITTILENDRSSVILTERGDLEPVTRHPDFRLFACMNPATDVGKKDLPPGLRARFTEIYVPPPDDDREALLTIIKQYLGDAVAGDRSAILDVAEFYISVKALAKAKEIVDGSNIPPHYSMRTLARALMFAVEVSPLFGLRRALWEGCLMTFTMSLDAESASKAKSLAQTHLLSGLRNIKATMAQVPSLPKGVDSDDYLRFGHFWLQKGSYPIPSEETYVLTPSVEAKLSDLARVILTRRFPVLIQGPTSSGKTSAVEFLARRTGHRFVRLNNHEHTDIQEYLGTYISDAATGKLVFQEGVLVKAVRQGHWIVLDELNLAPTDVLEALNRLLDDNRELVLPETQEVIRPHPHFMLFATQNPPGLYGGRKVLSRAFRNRFLEVHFDDVPQAELETIICQRCKIAPSYAARIVQVFDELRHRRQATRVFESKQSFATLRDLFRWAGRDAIGYQHLAENGFMLLAERARKEEDKAVVKEVIENIMKVTIDENSLYRIAAGPDSAYGRLGLPLPFEVDCAVTWTNAMQRLLTLVVVAAQYDEPILLVGETGCGKTSVCEVLAKVLGRKLLAVNCYQNMETADLLGSQRPIRNRAEKLHQVAKQLQRISITLGHDFEIPQDINQEWCQQQINQLSEGDSQLELQARIQHLQTQLQMAGAMFEWHDGPLVTSMRDGSVVLLDEVSLADDSVLERLNSVLEPSRTLVLAERGGPDVDELTVVGATGFLVVSTMNPGGDFGKKELSPALRNRFTEIWVPSLSNREDLLQIIGASWKDSALAVHGPLILDFVDWFKSIIKDEGKSGIGMRDILAWVNFTNTAFSDLELSSKEVFVHASEMTIIDGLETIPGLSGLSKESLSVLRHQCLAMAKSLAAALPGRIHAAVAAPSGFSIGGFAAPVGPNGEGQIRSYSLLAPTTQENAMRILRACQLPKAILLEGSPGVGKTTLIQALANVSGHNLCRINLSDQTDLVDLFGSDLPVVGGRPGEFAWRDAAFLTALKQGDWVLLDEMNLASQAILEGLNAVLDHRGTVYIPELGRSFQRHPDFRIFAAQNPMQQGGGRKGLPKSFLNRFTKVYVKEHEQIDMVVICENLFPELDLELLRKAIIFNSRLAEATMQKKLFGQSGSPWEFNLRDILRWLSLHRSRNGLEKEDDLAEFFGMVYLQRFRTLTDQQAVGQLFREVFDASIEVSNRPWISNSASFSQVGHSFMPISPIGDVTARLLRPVKASLPVREALHKCLAFSWLAILAGPAGAGKRSLVRSIADELGQPLRETVMHSGVDTMEMLGSFEQTDFILGAKSAVDDVKELLCDERLTLCLTTADLTVRDYHVTKLQYKGLSKESIEDRLGEAISAVSWHVSRFGPTDRTSRATAAVEQSMAALGNAARFEWIDGPLITAMKRGEWFLINDANLCSSSVLDRLNSLCEPGGSLILSEKGTDGSGSETIHPHPNFRLILAFDPKHGELSRAMRNRGVELYVAGQTVSDSDPEDVISVRMSEDSATSAALLCHIPYLASIPLDGNSSLLLSHSQAARILAQEPFSKSNLVWRHLQHWSSRLPRFSDILPSEMVDKITEASVLILSDRNRSTTWTNFFQSSMPFDFTINGQLAQSPMLRVISRCMALIFGSFSNHATALSLAHASKEGSKSVLSQSLLAMNRPVVRDQADFVVNNLYPALVALRGHLPMAVQELYISGGEFVVKQNLDSLEILSDIVSEVEAVSTSSTIDYSAFSVYINWIQNVLGDSPMDRKFTNLLNGLQSALNTSTGLGQTQLWKSFLIAPRDPSLDSVIARILASLNGKLGDVRIALPILDAIATLHFEQSDAKDYEPDLNELEATIANLSEICEPGPVGRDFAPLSVLHLSGLRNAFQQPSGTVNSVTCLVQSLGHSEQDLRKLLSLAHLTIADGNVSTNLAFCAISDWLVCQYEKSSSPVDVLSPILLASALGSTEKRQLRDIPLDANRWSISVTITKPRLETRMESRTFSLVMMALQAVIQVARAYYSSFSPEDFSWISRWQATPENLSSQIGLLMDWLRRSSFPPLVDCVNSNVASAFTKLSVTWPHSPLSSIGDLWLAVFQLIGELYVTSVPIDPAVSQLCQLRILDRQLDRLRDELRVYRSAEMNVTGDRKSAGTTAIEEDLDRIVLQRASASKGAIQRTGSESTTEMLGALFVETSRFFTEIGSTQKINSLTQSLAAVDDTVQAQARERDFQLATDSFLARLTATYSSLEDLVVPLRFAVYAAKLGISIHAHASHKSKTIKQDGIGASLLASLLSYPTLASASRVYASRSDAWRETVANVTDPLYLEISARGYAVAVGHHPQEHIQAISFCYDRVSYLWHADREKERADEQAAESLYRQRKTQEDVKSDLEAEAQEFAELFPTYEDEDDISVRGSRDVGAMSDEHSAVHILADRERGIYRLHLLLFGKSLSSNLGKTEFDAERLRLARTLLSDVAKWDENVDSYSVPLQARLLAQAKAVPVDVSAGSEYNFYMSPNPLQAKRGFEILDNLRNRLLVLREEWTEQMVLQHLLDRCESMLNMSSLGPVAQYLPAFEQLLTHSEDWEAFANKDNSLKPQQREIIDLIVSWRRLELSCWVNLLSQQATRYEEEVAAWWFKQYRLLISGPLALPGNNEISLESAENDYLKQVLPLLDEYLRGSSMGHFVARLQLLRSFGVYADLLHSADPIGNRVLSRVSIMIRSISRCYGQFESAVCQRLASQKAEIEKTVRDFVKIASWKDINVQALKASAKRTHGQLFKSIRKFREVLKSPVRSVITHEKQDIPAAGVETPVSTTLDIHPHDSQDLDQSNLIRASSVEVPRHLRLLSTTAFRFEDVLRNLPGFSMRGGFDTFESLATDIVDTVQALAKETPAVATETNAKLVRSLATRKRKALADLLKELRRLGFSSKVSQTQLDKQTSPVWLAEFTALCQENGKEVFGVTSILDKAESYHNRLQILLPVMRASLASHSDDILTQDLERAQGFAESVFAAALKARSRFSQSAKILSEIDLIIERFTKYVSEGISRESTPKQLLDMRHRLVHAAEVIREAISSVQATEVLFEGNLSGTEPAQAALRTLLTTAETILDGFSNVHKVIECGSGNVSKGEALKIQVASDFLNSLDQQLNAVARQTPSLSCFLEPAGAFLMQAGNNSNANGIPRGDDTLESVLLASDDVIETILVAAQDAVKAQESSMALLAADKSSAVAIYDQEVKELLASSRLAFVLEKLQRLDQSAARASIAVDLDSLSAAFKRTLPFLNAYSAFNKFYSEQQVMLMKSYYKLTFILASTFLTIAEKGFCKPTDSQTDASTGGQEQPNDGTGMGAGSGAQDVSNEIEDESQVEGLQGEKDEEQPDSNPEKQDGEDNALEMDNDFEGNLDDAENEDDGSGDSDGGDVDEEDTMDDHVGDVDQGVDEQFWGDDNGESAGEDDKLNEDRAEETGESEMVGKEEKEHQKETKKNAEQKDKPESNEDSDMPEGMAEQEMDEDADDDAAPDTLPEDDKRGGEALDPHVPDQETLDLPDDLKLDHDDDQDDDMDISGDEDGIDDEDMADEDGKKESDGPPTDTNDDLDEDMENEGNKDAEFAQPGDQDMPEEDLSNAQNQDLSAGNDDTRDTDMGGQQRGNDPAEYNNEKPEDQNVDQDDAEPTEDQATGQDGQQGGTTAGQSGHDEQTAGGNSDQQQLHPQPEKDRPRSLGDKIKEVRRLAQEISERSEQNEPEVPKTQDAPESRPGQVEHIRDDEDEEAQALGSADPNQHQSLADLHIVDDDTDPHGNDLPAMEDEDMDLADDQDDQKDRPVDTHSNPPPADPAVEKALTRADVDFQGAPNNVDSTAADTAALDIEPEDVEMLPADHVMDDSADLELVLQDWVQSGRDIGAGETLWRRYSAMTNDLSHVLCEQLRLILEPTLATRMQGDYRTGKRLNMRKIIPYIASEYTKDKIWLRRTKPSRREYQVMISLDDSRSMADSHSVHLAYQTMALVAQALTKLEVGQISIARFGEGVEILHPFGDRGFTDADGAKVMSSFAFDQHKTDVAELVQRSLTVLSDARQGQSGSTAPDLWQLEIIVSDGVCQDHPRLRTLLRRAMEERIMIVFLVLDSLQRAPPTGSAAPALSARTSILSMQTVSYQQINGEMQIEMQRYLDTFPFEYYVVLRDVEALPDTLAEILRQWLSRVAASEE